MAGARVEITTDTVGPALARALDALDGSGRKLMLEDMGEYLLRSTRERAARQVSPDGLPWRALEPLYKREKEKKRPGLPILKYDYHMLGDQLSRQVDDQGLQVGTNAPYGAAHQFGHTYKRAARTQELYFTHRAGAVLPRFVKKRKSNFAQTVSIGAHQTTLPARPWLGISAADEDELGRIVEDHLDRAMRGG